MRAFLIMITLIVSCAGVAFAQLDAIALFADGLGADCVIIDAETGPLNLYAFHVDSYGAKGSRFAMEYDECFSANYLGDTYVFATTIGTSQTGVGRFGSTSRCSLTSCSHRFYTTHSQCTLAPFRMTE